MVSVVPLTAGMLDCIQNGENGGSRCETKNTIYIDVGCDSDNFIYYYYYLKFKTLAIYIECVMHDA